MPVCKNCGFELQDLYCAHCGQKSDPQRITFHYLWHEVFHFFTHMEKGFLYTSWRMIVAPGETVTSFIDGKRKKHQPPISYFLIWVTLLILFLFLLEKIFGVNKVINYHDYFGQGTTTRMAISHLSLVLTAVIPFQAFYLFLLVTRGVYNYMESLVVIIYAIGTVILFQFVFAFCALLIHLLSGVSINLELSDSFKIVYISWMIINLIKYFPVKYKAIRIILFLVFAFGTFTLWRLYFFPDLVSLFPGTPSHENTHD